MASLQERLDAAFGALAPGTSQEPTWKPTAQQVFRSGPVDDGGNSSDEEYEEKQRRESVPGLAQSLVDEDEPDAEGFRPSTAFCRQLDAEEEYNDIDEVATGLISRRAGGEEALPPLDTQVLEDNVYEQRMRLQAAAQAAAAGAEQPGGMEVEGEAEERSPAAGRTAARLTPATCGASAAEPRRSSLASSSGGGGGSSGDAGLERRRVRFEGMAEPYVPPGRRDRAQAQRQGGSGFSHVPDHIKHPQKYTCYVLDEPLVVGGGVAQLAAGSQQMLPPAADDAAQQEPERWEGPPGSVQFVSRQQRVGGAAGTGPSSGSAAAAAMEPSAKNPGAHVTLCVAAEEVTEAGADVTMLDAAAEPAPAAAKGKRQYRTSHVTANEAG